MGNYPLRNRGRNGAIALISLWASLLFWPIQPVGAEQPEHLRRLQQTRICVNCNLKKANLKNATLTGALLRETTLKGANLEGADLRFAIIRNVNLKKANLTNADLTGAILRDVNLDKTILTGAKLPVGFDRPDPTQDFRVPEVQIQRPTRTIGNDI